MAPRGPKPKPTSLKVFEGNPGKRPLNASEPQPRTGRPACPAHVADDHIAKGMWDWATDELASMGLLTTADRLVLEMIATEYARLRANEIAAQKTGDVVKTQKGNYIQSPYLSIVNQSKKRLQLLMAEVGLTASSRTRLHVTSTDKPKAGVHDYARRKNG